MFAFLHRPVLTDDRSADKPIEGILLLLSNLCVSLHKQMNHNVPTNTPPFISNPSPDIIKLAVDWSTPGLRVTSFFAIFVGECNAKTHFYLKRPAIL